MEDEKLIKAFEDYCGFEIEIEDTEMWVRFNYFKAGYKLKEDEL